MTTSALLWRPSPERIEVAALTQFARTAAALTGAAFPDYASLWRWSVDDKEAFRNALWDFTGVIGTRGGRTLIDGQRMPGACWYLEARLNFAENLLARRAPHDAAPCRRSNAGRSARRAHPRAHPHQHHAAARAGKGITDIPRTKSGKIVELAVRDAVHDIAVKNTEALANPEALLLYLNREELRR